MRVKLFGQVVVRTGYCRGLGIRFSLFLDFLIRYLRISKLGVRALQNFQVKRTRLLDVISSRKDRLYCDIGPSFSSQYLSRVCAHLGGGLVHSKPYDSPSRGPLGWFFTHDPLKTGKVFESIFKFFRVISRCEVETLETHLTQLLNPILAFYATPEVRIDIDRCSRGDLA